MYIDQAIRWDLIERNLPPPPVNVFEIGCGSGEFLHHLAAKGYNVRGCELSTANWVSGQTEAIKPIIAASGTAIPLPDSSIDCTISSDVLEHVEPSDRRKFIEEMIRITKPGGSIVFTVWVRPTFAFHLMKYAYLLRWGYLPGWYLEHVTIRPPAQSEIAGLLSERARLSKVHPYHAFLGHIIAALQHVCFKHNSRGCRLSTACARLISLLDVFGVKASCLFVATKPLPESAPN